MTLSSRQKLTFVSAAAALLIGLTGCSAAGGGVTVQSKAAACSSLQHSLTSVTSDLQSSMSSIMSDPDAAVGALQKVATSFDGALGKITNADVKKAGQKADDSLKGLITAVKNAKADPSGLSKAAGDFSDSFSAIGKVCK
jgi:hypothetical protein